MLRAGFTETLPGLQATGRSQTWRGRVRSGGGDIERIRFRRLDGRRRFAIPRGGNPTLAKGVVGVCASSRNGSMNHLGELAALLVDAVNNLDPQEFNAIAAAVARFKTDHQAAYSMAMTGCPEFATLFGAIERAVANP